jgi:hypothetical protein
MNKKIRDEYYLLSEKLDEIRWALEGECDDIDCDEYLYKNLLKNKYKPVLEHDFSCMENLNRNKAAVMRLLSQKKFRKFRYEMCTVCNKNVDKLHGSNTIVSYTRPSETDKKYFHWEGIWAHKHCQHKVKIPKGWQKFR